MPTNGDDSDEPGFDPLEQPPLVRRRDGRAGAGSPPDPVAAESGAGVETAVAGPPGKAARPRGRFLGFLGLVAGLAGLGAAGYLYYLLVYLNPEGDLVQRIGAVERQVSDTSGALEAQQRAQNEALQDLADQERRARDALADRILGSVNDLAAAAPPSRREWKIAEVAYLLRIANHRVLMEHDVPGALVLLKAGDAILKELDDFALYPVRARLSAEIESLQKVKSVDVQGLFLRIEAVKTEIARQHVKLPRFEKESSTIPPEPGFWAALSEQIGSYLRFRRFEGEAIQPLLAPEEATYLELNLRLMLEQAQLAALKRETAVYQQSLQTAASWIATYMDTDDPAMAHTLDELESLSGFVLDEPLPDISGSLNALKALGDA